MLRVTYASMASKGDWEAGGAFRAQPINRTSAVSDITRGLILLMGTVYSGIVVPLIVLGDTPSSRALYASGRRHFMG